MFCSSCGKRLDDGIRFCTNCGRLVSDNNDKEDKRNKHAVGKVIFLLTTIVFVIGLVTIIYSDISKYGYDSQAERREIVSLYENESENITTSKETKSINNLNVEMVMDESSNDVDYALEIKYLYKHQLEYETEIRAIILSNLERASYIQYVDEGATADYRKMITDALVDDVVEGKILSDVAKRTVDSICENKSVEEILSDTTDSLILGTKNYLESTAENYLKEEAKEIIFGDAKEILEIVPFDEITWINEFFHVDDTPNGLLNGIISLQKKDVSVLISLLSKESFRPGELQYIILLYDRIVNRQSEIMKSGGNTTALDGSEQLNVLVNGCEECRGKIYYYSTLLGGEEVRDENLDLKFASKYVKETEVMLPCNYDVEGYRNQQKSARQSSMFIGKFVGDLLGNMAKDDLENNQKTAQSNRVVFSEKLEKHVEESALMVCLSKGFLNELYYASVASIEGGSTSIVTKDMLISAITEYLNQVYKYVVDINTATVFWKIITSDYNVKFVSDLENALNEEYFILQNGIDDGFVPIRYEYDEECARYIDILDAYVEYLKLSVVYSNCEPQYGRNSSITAYHVGTFDTIFKGQSGKPIILREEQMKTNLNKEKYLWLYDTDGNPLYVENQFGRTYVMDSQMILFTGSDENIGYQIKYNADRIIEDIMSGDIAHSYVEYVMY